MIEHYDGDIDKVKDLLEKKDFNLLNLVNGKIINLIVFGILYFISKGIKRVTRSLKTRFRNHVQSTAPN